MLDAGDTTLEFNPAVEPLLKIVQFVRLDASKLDPATLRSRSEYLHARGTHVVAGHVDDHDTYHRCESLPLQAIQGQFLLKPEPVAVPVLAASRLQQVRKALADTDQVTVALVELLALSQVVLSPEAYGVNLNPIANQPYFEVVEINQRMDRTTPGAGSAPTGDRY